jgi:hypothetical protein
MQSLVGRWWQWLREQAAMAYRWLVPKSKHASRARLFQYKDFCIFSISMLAFLVFTTQIESMLRLDMT